MIRKLRRKFVLINMLCVISILIVVLGLMFSSYYRRARNNTTFFMENDLSRAMGETGFGNSKIGKSNSTQGTSDTSGTAHMDGDGDGHPGMGPGGPAGKGDSGGFLSFFDLSGSKGNQKPGNFLPSVIFKVDADGNVLSTTERELSVDDTTAKTLVANALASRDSDGFGYIKDYRLRYLVREASDGSFYVVFADNSFEYDNIRQFLVTCIIIFVVAFVLFLILSYFLARWALAPVEKAWKQQSQFVADASHELKTPITVILANLDILSAHRSDTIARQSRWIENTKDEAERMKQLIQDLLFLAKSDAGTVAVVMSEVDLSDCIMARILNFESVAFEKKVELESDVKPGLKISGNEGQLKQLVTILLDNAVKYAGQNGKVMVKAFQENDKNIIEVNNTGEPIPETEIGHIFERFYRTDKSRVHTEGGYGLGLSIADNIVKTHHGVIRCRSNAADGTTFTVELPGIKQA
jgi:two-component system sensor histidine kinase CiaH